jgi:hypothetical protein
MERDSTWQAQTDSYMASFGVNICGNEYTASANHIVRSLFATPTGANPDPRPLFVVINCISNTLTRQYREVLLNAVENGGGTTDFSAQIASWRNIIDAVQAAPPRITDVRLATNDIFRFTVSAQRGRTNRVECTTNFVDWTTITNISGTNAPVIVRDTNVLANPRRFYRLLRL